jgi:predicted CopG family antitoxin
MAKRVTIEDGVYDALRSLKEYAWESVSDVIRGVTCSSARTAGELLAFREKGPVPKLVAGALKEIRAQRGGRSHRRFFGPVRGKRTI